MKSICIGIHVHTEPAHLQATLASLRANALQQVELVLLPDGPDRATIKALASLRALRQLGTSEPAGAPACFNRLAAATKADLVVLLESGAIVGPGWLDHLLAALAADPANGLAGPSTNRAWNEQCVFPNSGGALTEVAQTASLAKERFGNEWRTLEPLHSLADFCYAVKREVIETVGAVDEGYGLGPCWEMDYNIRAARAGFRGVWACGAFVYRSTSAMRRRNEESRRFEANKHRYQDKFCALRLRGERSDYERHCLGDECEHFAPAPLIQIQLPLTTNRPPDAPAQATVSKKRSPLVSCIMPTRDRWPFVLQAIKYFQRQDYPELELIIVDDSDEDYSGQMPKDGRIRYEHLSSRQSIGAKRNRACEMARGEIVLHWDDDDWYAANRVSAQAPPLVAGEAEITALPAGVFFDLDRWEFWACAPELHRRLFVGDVHGGTLAYRRSVWREKVRYPNISLAEDAYFIRKATNAGARLRRIPNEGLFVYLRHRRNAWAFDCGRHVDPQGWRRVSEPLLPAEDRSFYAAHSPAMANVRSLTGAGRSVSDHPLVSCIMPTANRRRFAPQAIQYFLRQDYPNRELIIVDDGAEAISDLVPNDSRIRYIRLEGKRTIGAKRNLACHEAAGEVVIHWDDDDWMANWRLTYQIESLLKEGADICGLSNLLHFDIRSKQSWRYNYPNMSKPWVSGNTLCYIKSFWEANHFPEINVGEDTRFVWSNRPKRILPLQNSSFYVALIHKENTSPKLTQDHRWQPVPTQEIRSLLGEDWIFYQSVLCR